MLLAKNKKNLSLSLCIYTLSLFFVLVPSVFSQNIDSTPLSEGNKWVKTSIISDIITFQPSTNETIPVARIAIKFTIEPNWHIYWKNSGEAAFPTSVSWNLPAGFKASKVFYPTPHKIVERGNLVVFGYSEEVVLVSEIFAPTEIPLNDQSIEVKADVEWLVCKDTCVPGSSRLSKKITYSIDKPLSVSPEFDIIENYYLQTPEGLAKKFPIASKSFKENFSDFIFLKGAPSVDTSNNKEDPENNLVINLLGSTSEVGAKDQTSEKKSQNYKFLGINKDNFQVFPNSKNEKYFSSSIFSLEDIPQLASSGITSAQSLSQVFLRVPFTPLKHDSKTKSISLLLAFKKELLKPFLDNGELARYPKLPNVLSLNKKFSLPVQSSQIQALQTFDFKKFKKNSSELQLNSHSTTKSEKPSLASESSLASLPVGETSILALLSIFYTAFIAGLILNLMPCVLPILAIKVTSFVETKYKKQSPLVSAIAYTLGIIFSFEVIAVTLLFIRQTGGQVTWGFQFQSPFFTLSAALIIFLLALNFFGVFEFRIPFINKVNKLSRKIDQQNDRFISNFFDGILATTLSTPCTAPFLGTALIVAFSQSVFVCMSIFFFLGLGLAMPYVILSIFPRLTSFLPKPGNWMYRFKELMGFLLLATVAWLVHVFSNLADGGAGWILFIILSCYFSLWFYKSICSAYGDKKRFQAYSLIIFGLLCNFSLTLWSHPLEIKNTMKVAISSDLISWESFSEELLVKAKKENRQVFIDFTADWCVTCKFNEHTAIETEAVSKKIKETNTLALRADWTRGDKVITKYLQKYGSQGVPLYVVIPPDNKKEKILSSIITQGILINALEDEAFSQATTPQ